LRVAFPIHVGESSSIGDGIAVLVGEDVRDAGGNPHDDGIITKPVIEIGVGYIAEIGHQQVVGGTTTGIGNGEKPGLGQVRITNRKTGSR